MKRKLADASLRTHKEALSYDPPHCLTYRTDPCPPLTADSPFDLTMTGFALNDRSEVFDPKHSELTLGVGTAVDKAWDEAMSVADLSAATGLHTSVMRAWMRPDDVFSGDNVYVVRFSDMCFRIADDLDGALPSCQGAAIYVVIAGDTSPNGARVYMSFSDARNAWPSSG